jgi:hypothetical protein
MAGANFGTSWWSGLDTTIVHDFNVAYNVIYLEE